MTDLSSLSSPFRAWQRLAQAAREFEEACRDDKIQSAVDTVTTAASFLGEREWAGLCDDICQRLRRQEKAARDQFISAAEFIVDPEPFATRSQPKIDDQTQVERTDP